MSVGRHLLTIVFVALSGFVMLCDFSALSVALPSIAAQPGMTPPLLSLVGSMNTLVFASFLIFGGRLTDLYGPVRTCTGGLVLYLAGALVAASAHGAPALIGARAMQGLSFALMGPAGFSQLNTGLPHGPWRNRGLGVYAATQGAGMIAGSVLGGAVTTWWGWRAVFLMNVPTTLATLALAAVLLRRQPELTRPGRLDLLGSVLIAAGTVLVISALAQIGQPGRSWIGTAAILGAGVLSYLAFVVHERSTVEPLIPAALFRNRRMMGNALAALCIMVAAAAMFVLPNLYMQRVLGFSAARSGFGMLPQALTNITTGGVLAYAIGRFSYRRNLSVACTIYVLGLSLFLVLPLMLPRGGYGVIIGIPLVLSSFGGAFGAFAILADSTANSPAHQQGIVTSFVMSSQQIGMALGVALTLTIAGSGPAFGIGTLAALRYAYLACIVAAVVGACCALRICSDRMRGDGASPWVEREPLQL